MMTNKSLLFIVVDHEDNKYIIFSNKEDADKEFEKRRKDCKSLSGLFIAKVITS